MLGVPYEQIYEVLAFVLSLCFPAMAAVIVLRAAVWVRHDSRARRRTLQSLPDAGNIGELAIIRDASGQMQKGDCIAVPHEGVLGSARVCDVVIRHEDVPARAAQFVLTREGLMMTPSRGMALRVNGETYAEPVTLTHGHTLQWGGLRLRLRLFEGTEALAASRAPVAAARARRVQKEAPISTLEELMETAEPVDEPEIDIPLDVEHRPPEKTRGTKKKPRRRP